MQTSNRRNAATAAVTPTAADAALAAAKARVKAGTANLSEREMVEGIDAARIGAIARERDAAIDAVSSIAALDGRRTPRLADALAAAADAAQPRAPRCSEHGAALVPDDCAECAAVQRIGAQPSRRATRPALPWTITEAELAKVAWAQTNAASRQHRKADAATWADASSAALLALIAAMPRRECECVGTLDRRYGVRDRRDRGAAVVRWIDAPYGAECPTCDGARTVPDLDRRRVNLDGENPDTAILNAAHNAAQTTFRHAAVNVPLSADELAAAADAAADEALEDAQPTAEELAAALRLNGAQRDALALAVGGIKREELARLRGVGVEAVKKSAQRGRKSLDRILPPDPEDERQPSKEALARLHTATRRILADDPRDPCAAARAIGALMGAGEARTGARKMPTWDDRMPATIDAPEGAPWWMRNGGYAPSEDGAPYVLPTRNTNWDAARTVPELHGGALALPRVPEVLIPPLSERQTLGAALRHRTRLSAAHRRPLAPAHGLADCTLPNMADAAAEERAMRLRLVRQMLRTERRILRDGDKLERLSLPTLSGLIYAAMSGRMSLDRLASAAAYAARIGNW